MKKKALSNRIAAMLLIVSLLPAVSKPAHAATASADAATQAIYQGMSGEAVGTLQNRLKQLGYFTYPTVTYYFGAITAQAVRSFQQAYGLPETGSADAATQKTLSRAIVKQQLIKDCFNYIHVPYVWGGSTPAGFDCSGFVYFMFRKHGIPFARTTSELMAAMGTPVSRASLQPGDWVFFGLNTPGVVTHVGIYTGNGEFISATRSQGIYIQGLDSSYWGPKYIAARRFY